jgi:hypothetical protein
MSDGISSFSIHMPLLRIRNETSIPVYILSKGATFSSEAKCPGGGNEIQRTRGMVASGGSIDVLTTSFYRKWNPSSRVWVPRHLLGQSDVTAP